MFQMKRKARITFIVYDKKKPARWSSIDWFVNGRHNHLDNHDNSCHFNIPVPRHKLVHVVFHIGYGEPTRFVIVGLGELKANCEYIANLIVLPRTQRTYMVEIGDARHASELKTGASAREGQ